MVKDSLKFYDGKYFKLIAYCIMSNHVHVIVDQEGYQDISLSDIFGRIKGFSAYESNKIIGKKGEFWSQEIYDHYTRSNSDLEFYIKYTLNNPVAANLVDNWRDWPHSFVLEEYIDDGF